MTHTPAETALIAAAQAVAAEQHVAAGVIPIPGDASRFVAFGDIAQLRDLVGAATPAQPIADVSAPTDEQVNCPGCDGKGGYATSETWVDPVSGPECEGQTCEECSGTGKISAEEFNQPLFAASAAAPTDEPPQGFIDYVRANYNGVVDIHAPEWHAKRLWRSAMHHAAARAAAPVSGQAASIDTPEFRKMARSMMGWHLDEIDEGKAIDTLIAYIDSRPRSKDSRAEVRNAALEEAANICQQMFEFFNAKNRPELAVAVDQVNSQIINLVTSSTPEMVDLLGVKPNGETVLLGKVAMPPRMKAKELIRELIGGDFEDEGSDAAMWLYAFERFIEFMESHRPDLATTAAPERSGQGAQPQPAIQTPEKKTTSRGFSLVEFTDRYGAACSLQKSSLATEDAIWLGCDDAAPKIMAAHAAANGVATSETTGWVPFPIPDAVSLNTRMHLTQDQVAMLLPILAHFVETGEVVAAAPAIQAQPLTDAEIEWLASHFGTEQKRKYVRMTEFARCIEKLNHGDRTPLRVFESGATPARGGGRGDA